MFKEQKGITLVALVITIIVLLILAGVTIAALSGPNGILTNATQARGDTLKSEAKEAVTMAINTILTNKYAGVAENTTTPGSEVFNNLTLLNIVTEINNNYGGTAATNGTDKIDYTSGGYKVTVTLDTANNYKVKEVSDPAKATN